MTQHPYGYGDAVPALIHGIPHLAGIPESKRLSRFALMFHYESYADDTGNDPMDFLFCLAAWVGRIEQWLPFSNDWQSELDAPPKIDYFKHYEAVSGKGCFKNISGDDALEKIMALSRVISKYGDLYGVVVSIERAKFREIIDRYAIKHERLPKRSKEYYSDPFFTIFHCLIADVARVHCEKFQPIQDQIDFIFDDKGNRASRPTRRCIEVYEQWRAELMPPLNKLFGAAYPANDKAVVALQACDLLAGQYRMNCMFDAQDKIPKPMAFLRHSMDIHAKVIGEMELVPFIERINSFTLSMIRNRIKKRHAER